MTFVCATGSGSNSVAIIINGLQGSDITISSSYEAENGNKYNIVGIGKEAFKDYTNLNTLVLEEGIVTINNNAFQGCSNLKKLVLPKTIKYLGANPFNGCNSLIHICCDVKDANVLDATKFPKKEMMTLYVPNINDYKFKGAWNNQFNGRIFEGKMISVPFEGFEFVCSTGSREATLYKVLNEIVGDIEIHSTIQDENNTEYKVTGIDRFAFSGSSSIKTITIPENVTIIGPNAFSGCSSLLEVSLPASLEIIGSGVFSGCNNLTRIESKRSTPIDIPDNLFVINNNIEKILYCPNVSSYENVNGWKYGFTYFLQGYKNNDITYEHTDKDRKKICDITYATGSDLADAIIIGVTNLVPQSLEVPAIIDGKNVQGVYRDAFKQASSIEQLSFLDGTVGLTIGKGALNGCSKLRLLKLPSRLEKLGSGAFSSCNSLAHILFKSDASILGSDVFSNTTKTNACIYIPTGSIPQDFVNVGWNINNIVNADLLEEFKVKKGMTYIGWKQTTSDKGTAKLTNGIPGSSEELFEIDNSATSEQGTTYNVVGIANNAFSNTGSFKTLKIAEGIVSIGASAFRNRPLTRIILPESLKSIGENAFNSCRNLIDIEAHEGKELKFEEIGANAFLNCTSLAKITLPSTLTSIGLSAFAGCSKLTEIVSKIQSPYDIDASVFANYSATLYVPYGSDEAYKTTNGWKNFGDHISIGNRVEYSEKGLNYVYAAYGKTATLIKSDPEEKIPEILDTIPGTDVVVTAIAESAFKDNRNIESIIIPDNIKTIGAKAFENCTNVKKIELSKSLTYIGDNAFGGLINLKTLISKIPADNLENLCSSISKVFTSDNYPSITTSPEIYIPVGENSESVYKDKWSAFYEGKFVVGYPSYDVQSTDRSGWYFDILTTIDESKVDDENSADVIYGSATLKKTNDRAETDGNLVIPSKVKFGERTYEITKIADNAFNDYPNKNSVVKQLSIPETVTGIGANAFRGFSSVQKIWLPESLTSIGAKAFDGCNAITHVCSKMKSPKSMSDDLFSIPEVNTATLFVPSTEGYTSSWNKFSNVVEIGAGDYITDTEDGGMVFACYTVKGEGNETSKCAILTKSKSNNISEALIKEKVKDEEYTVRSIGKYAFRNCAKLAKVELPSSLVGIGDYAFSGCSSIIEIVSDIEKKAGIGLLEFSDNVFDTNIYTLANVYIPSGEQNLEVYQNAKGWNNFKKPFEQGKWLMTEEAIGNFKYKYHTAQKIATVTEIVYSGNETNTITIPSSFKLKENDDISYYVTEVAPTVFTNFDKSAVNTLIIEDGIYKIGENAFKDCKNLTSAVLPSSLKTIGAYAFSSTKITELRMAGVESIGASAFQGCSSLKKVWLPSTLTSVGENAFAGCNALTHVSIDAMSKPNTQSEFVPSNSSVVLFVPTGKRDEYEGEPGWQYFAKVYEGHFVDEITPKTVDYENQTFICLTSGYGDDVENTAILTKSKTTTEDVKIPQTVQSDGVPFTVTDIDNSAFSGSSNLKNLTIPETVVKIGESAFATCTQLTNIICKVESPVSISSTVFPKVPAALYVPNKEKYAAAANWNAFSPMYNGERRTGTNDVLNLTYEYATGEQEARLIKGASTAAEVTIDSYVPGTAQVQDGSMYIQFEDSRTARSVESGMTVTAGEAESKISSVGTDAQGNTFAIASTTLKDGTYSVKVIFRRTQVLSLLFE